MVLSHRVPSASLADAAGGFAQRPKQISRKWIDDKDWKDGSRLIVISLGQ